MDNQFKNNAYNILEVFMEQPNKNFSVRGIARELKINHATVLRYIIELKKKGLIKVNETTLYPTYYANTENDSFKIYKKNQLVFKINNSGLITFIQKESLPSSIILFGSGAKGTSTEDSDIDIFVEAKRTELNITKFEKMLGKRINLLFEPSLKSLSNELMNNIINGIVLYGFIRIR